MKISQCYVFLVQEKCLTLPESSKSNRNLLEDINSPEQWVSYLYQSFKSKLEFECTVLQYQNKKFV